MASASRLRDRDLHDRRHLPASGLRRRRRRHHQRRHAVDDGGEWEPPPPAPHPGAWRCGATIAHATALGALTPAGYGPFVMTTEPEVPRASEASRGGGMGSIPASARTP